MQVAQKNVEFGCDKLRQSGRTVYADVQAESCERQGVISDLALVVHVILEISSKRCSPRLKVTLANLSHFITR